MVSETIESDNMSGEYYARLKRIHGEKAVVVIGNESHSVPITEREKRWQGKYFLLWRMPAQYAGTIYPGDNGPAVRWIDEQLSVIQGNNDKSRPTDVHHDKLVQRVRQFQTEEGLSTDGIIGSQTFIAILNKTGTNEPTLLP